MGSLQEGTTNQGHHPWREHDVGAGMSRLRPRLGRPLAIYPLLLTAYPVLFLFAQNLTEVSVGQVITPLARAVAAGFVVTLVAGIVLRDVRRGALIATALLVAWFGFGHMADLLAPLAVSRAVQLAGWALFLCIALLAALFLRERWISRTTSALNLAGVVLVTLTLVQIVPFESSQPAQASRTAPVTAAPGARDIYYLIFDRYGSNASFQAWVGVQSDLPAWLASQGFSVESGAHANYIRTELSLAATLNMQPLDSIAAKMGRSSNDLGPIDQLLQDSAAGEFLKAHGYRYINIGSWYYPTQSIRIADENLFLDTTTDFDAMLDKTTFNPTLDSLLGIPVMPPEDAIHRDSALYQLATLPSVEQAPGPKFVVAHILLPHPPYVFDADGSYPSAQEQSTRTQAQAFEAQLKYTNDQIRSIVRSLLSRPADQQPIIVLQADEGPYPEAYRLQEILFDWSKATTDQLETKYGILDAFYLPGTPPAGAPEPYSTMTSWNTFPILFDRYFGMQIPLLPDRSFTSSSYTKPYDFTDITNRLPGAATTN